MTAPDFENKNSRAVQTPLGMHSAETPLPPLNACLVDTLFKLASGQTAADCPA